MLYSGAATPALFLVASLFFSSSSSVEARRTTTSVRRASSSHLANDDYVWTITWTGPKTCTSWPCSYSYTVAAPAYTAADGSSIPVIGATCQGTVDQTLKACSLTTSSTNPAAQQQLAVAGNFSTFETSGVGAGLIDITATWSDDTSGESSVDRKLAGTTPKQNTAANGNTWTLHPEGCPITDCVATNATGSSLRRRGYIDIEI